jgi:sugar/nucleoside kinase (ribokinase family)
MVIEAEEAEQFAAIADALLINVGTLTAPRAQSMRRAIESAVAAGKPWTLDPVAVGALTFRTRFCHQILALKPAAIRGNASEILALAGMSAAGAASIRPIPPPARCLLHRRWPGRSIPLWWSPARWITSPTGSVPER